MKPKFCPGDLVQLDASTRFWDVSPAIVISVSPPKQKAHEQDIHVPWQICRLLIRGAIVEKYHFTLKKIV